MHRNPALSFSPQAVYYTEPCPQAIPPSAPSPPPSPISRVRPALARVCTLTPAGRPLARASPAWTALPSSAPIQLQTSHRLCYTPHPTPSAPLGGTCVSSLADCQKFPSTLWAGDRFFKNCFPLFSVSLPYLLLPSFPLFSFDCSLFPLQFHCLASPLARFPSPHMFALLKSFKDVSGILAHSPHSAERGTLH